MKSIEEVMLEYYDREKFIELLQKTYDYSDEEMEIVRENVTNMSEDEYERQVHIVLSSLGECEPPEVAEEATEDDPVTEEGSEEKTEEGLTKTAIDKNKEALKRRRIFRIATGVVFVIGVGVLALTHCSLQKGKKGSGNGSTPTTGIEKEYNEETPTSTITYAPNYYEYDQGEKYENASDGINVENVKKGDNGKYYDNSESANDSKQVKSPAYDELGGYYDENRVYHIYGEKYESRELFEEIRDSEESNPVKVTQDANGVYHKYQKENVKTK